MTRYTADPQPTVPVTTPRVSVLMITRNHGAFLAQAIDSVLTQDMVEDLELLIGEDGSDDDSAAVCADYSRRFPDRVRVTSSPQGAVGMHANFRRLLDAARGRYLAFLEGDDYWLTRDKLSRQVALLEGTATLSMCGTRTLVIERDGAGVWRLARELGPAHRQAAFTFAEMIPHYNFHFSSVVVRHDAVNLPPWVSEHYCIDRPLYLLATQHGDAGSIDEVTSAYRQHDGGVWSGRGLLYKAASSRALFLAFQNYFPARFRPAFRRALAGILWYYLSLARAGEDRRTALKLLGLAVAAAPVHVLAGSGRGVLSHLVWLLSPRLHRAVRATGVGA